MSNFMRDQSRTHRHSKAQCCDYIQKSRDVYTNSTYIFYLAITYLSISSNVFILKMYKRILLLKWALVYWVDTQNWSVVESKQVVNIEMLYDSSTVWMVEFTTHGKSQRNRWGSFRGRVLATRGKNHFSTTV